MPQILRLHLRKLVLIFSIAFTSVLACLWVGDVKTWAEIDWLDVVGEGGSSIALAVWMILILSSRPAGRVTDLLTLGLGFMFLAMWQDNLDEFIRIPSEQWWDHWLESVAMPVGIGLLTYGLFHWHSEQLAINQQLKRREQLFREHRYTDSLTQLGRVDYLKAQIQRQRVQTAGGPFALVMLEIEQFSTVARRLGHRESDRLLREMAEIILLNIRQQDLVCRFAGDRFALLLPDTTPGDALILAQQVQMAIAHFAFKTSAGETLYQRLRAGVVADSPDKAPAALLEKANAALLQARMNNGCYLAA